MEMLLTLVTGFGYLISAVMVGTLVAWHYQEEIIRALDATIPWPNDDTATLYELRNEVIEARSDTDYALHEALEALAALPQHVPVWEPPCPETFPHGLSLPIVRSHPGGTSAGYDAAYTRWKSLHARE